MKSLSAVEGTVRPADPDDIDARFEALVAQFDEDEIRRMTEAAEQDALPRPAVRRRLPLILASIAAVVLVAGLVLTVRPDALQRLGIVRTETGGEDTIVTGPVFARPGPVLTPIPDGEEGLWDHGPAQALPVADPFAGTPATGYADGEQGLVMPVARALGGLTAEEVGRALRRVRLLLSAAHLDPVAIGGGEPEEFARLLTARQRERFLDHLDEGGASGTRSWLFSLAPGTAVPVGDVVKVSGQTSLSKRAGGGVAIEADYLFVHPVSRSGDPLSVVRVVEHHRTAFSAYERDGELVVWLDDDASAVFGADCDADDGFVHPRFPGDTRKARATGEPVDPYDLGGRVSRRPACPASLGT